MGRGDSQRTIRDLKEKLAVCTKQLQSNRQNSHILSQSSMEAYGGLTLAVILGVLSMTYWLRALLFIGLMGLWGDFLWRSPFTYKWHKPIKTVVISGVIFGIGWVGWANVKTAYDAYEFPANVRYITTYGPADPRTKVHPWGIDGIAAGVVKVNGDLLQHFSDRYNLVAICFIWDGKEDFIDSDGISKSAAFDITSGEISMLVPWNEKFIATVEQHGYGQTNYGVLLVPKNVSPDSFSSIRSAQKKGAKLLEHGATGDRPLF